jgi:hypothetical protein
VGGWGETPSRACTPLPYMFHCFAWARTASHESGVSPSLHSVRRKPPAAASWATLPARAAAAARPSPTGTRTSASPRCRASARAAARRPAPIGGSGSAARRRSWLAAGRRRLAVPVPARGGAEPVAPLSNCLGLRASGGLAAPGGSHSHERRGHSPPLDLGRAAGHTRAQPCRNISHISSLLNQAYSQNGWA